MTTLYNHKEALRNWWESLSGEWQGIFAFNYYIKTNFDSIFERMKESVDYNSLEEGEKYNTYNCNPAFITFKREFEVPAIIHYTLEDELLFNWLNTYYLFAEDEQKKPLKLKVSFDIKSLTGLKDLKQIEKVYLFNNIINIDELNLFPELETINIKPQQLTKIPEIIQLNLKNLKTVNVFMSDYTIPVSSYPNKECEVNIEKLQKLSDLHFNIVYDDLNDMNNFEVDMNSKDFFHHFVGLDEPTEEEAYLEHLALNSRK